MRNLASYRAALGVLAALILAALSPLAHAASGGAPIAYLYCYSGSTRTSPASWAPCSVSNPLQTTGGGGGGGGAVYGPTAAASPAANPPVLIGGTVDGSATGNVAN